jgi:DNA-binding Lrp family transcriptional regulator
MSEISAPTEPHSATVLMRLLIEKSDEYARFMERSLNVNETDFKAMEHLMQNGPMTAGELARAVGVSPGAATTMIDRLVKVGHISREPNKNDRRGIVVVPNSRSIVAAWGFLAPVIQTSEKTIRSMSETSQKAIVEYLAAMIDAFSNTDK